MTNEAIERVARALCEAEGQDPDKLLGTGLTETVQIGETTTEVPKTKPNWSVFEKDARKFLAALEAAAATEAVA